MAWKDTGTGTYYPSKVLSIKHGVLDYYVHTGTVRGKRVHMVAALLPKISGTVDGGLLYGRYVIRFRAAALPGYHAAFLLWPESNDWPYGGEIDFPEGNLDQRVFAFMHHRGAIRGSQQDAYATRAKFTSWHTATIRVGAEALPVHSRRQGHRHFDRRHSGYAAALGIAGQCDGRQVTRAPSYGPTGRPYPDYLGYGLRAGVAVTSNNSPSALP